MSQLNEDWPIFMADQRTLLIVLIQQTVLAQKRGFLFLLKNMPFRWDLCCVGLLTDQARWAIATFVCCHRRNCLIPNSTNLMSKLQCQCLNCVNTHCDNKGICKISCINNYILSILVCICTIVHVSIDGAEELSDSIVMGTVKGCIVRASPWTTWKSLRSLRTMYKYYIRL